MKCTAGSAPTSTRVSPLHSPAIKAAGSEGLSGHDTPEKEGTEEIGVGYFQSVLLVARTLDSQITAGAHLCQLCFLTRSLTPDSCVGCLPNPCLDRLSLVSVLFPRGRVLTLTPGQARSDLKASPSLGFWFRFKPRGERSHASSLWELPPALGLAAEVTFREERASLQDICPLLADSHGVQTWPSGTRFAGTSS